MPLNSFGPVFQAGAAAVHCIVCFGFWADNVWVHFRMASLEVIAHRMPELEYASALYSYSSLASYTNVTFGDCIFHPKYDRI